jgi:hypothetical protein
MEQFAEPDQSTRSADGSRGADTRGTEPQHNAWRRGAHRTRKRKTATATARVPSGCYSRRPLGRWPADECIQSSPIRLSAFHRCCSLKRCRKCRKFGPRFSALCCIHAPRQAIRSWALAILPSIWMRGTSRRFPQGTVCTSEKIVNLRPSGIFWFRLTKAMSSRKP